MHPFPGIEDTILTKMFFEYQPKPRCNEGGDDDGEVKRK